MTDSEEEAKQENTEGAEGGEGVEGEADEEARKKRRKKKIIFISIGVVVLLASIGAGLFFTGIVGGHGSEDDLAQEDKVQTPSAFVDLPELLVNLNTKGKRQSFLKLVITLEIGKKEDEKIIEEMKPKIIDKFQVYLREVRPEDLRSSGGIYRLREELLRRVAITVSPVEVRDILFKDIVTQ